MTNYRLPYARALALGIGLASATITVASPAYAQEPEGETTPVMIQTYKMVLFLTEGTPQEPSLRRFSEIVPEEALEARLGLVPGVGEVIRLEEIVVRPNRESPALVVDQATIRVNGEYRPPRQQSMLLRIVVDGGSERFMKEVLSRFDETIIVTYPFEGEDRSLVAVIFPVEVEA